PQLDATPKGQLQSSPPQDEQKDSNDVANWIREVFGK
ncbi:bifunctional glycosyl transferase/transpeptidase, partial [Sodalis-like endosymbiont of Proechinophthirus fluctus]